MGEKRSQLRYSSLIDLIDQKANDGMQRQCVCCLRFIHLSGPSTVKLDLGAGTLCALFRPSMDICPDMFYRQMKLLNDEEFVACFICEPNIKKAMKQLDTANVVESPSKFIYDSLQCVQDGKFTFKNYFSIFKGIICITSELTTPTATYCNPFRSANNDMLEGVVAYMKKMAVYNKNDDDHSTERLIWGSFCEMDDFESRVRKTPPVEEIIALVRWLHRGCGNDPLTLRMNTYKDTCEETSSLRRGMRNEECLNVFLKMNPKYQEYQGKGVCLHCAGCRDCFETLQQEDQSTYAAAVMCSWDVLKPYITHCVSLSDSAAFPPYTIFCVATNTIQLRSFEYYKKELCQNIPTSYQFKTARHFYSWQLQMHNKFISNMGTK